MKITKQIALSLALMAPVAHAGISAKAYIVTDLQGRVLLEKNADEIRSIASITKLITARFSAEDDQTEMITITREDLTAGRMKTTPLRAGESYTRAQLTSLSLVSSDNVAAIALGRTIKLPRNELPTGMKWTEGSGLDPANVASARTIAEVARDLIDTDVSRASVLASVAVNDQVRKSTNPLIGKPGWNFDLSKTGFISAAGACVVSIFTDGTGRKLVAVVLGSRTVPERWRDLYFLRRELDPSSSFASPGGEQAVSYISTPRYKLRMYKNRKSR